MDGVGDAMMQVVKQVSLVSEDGVRDEEVARGEGVHDVDGGGQHDAYDDDDDVHESDDAWKREVVCDEAWAFPLDNQDNQQSVVVVASCAFRAKMEHQTVDWWVML